MKRTREPYVSHRPPLLKANNEMERQRKCCCCYRFGVRISRRIAGNKSLEPEWIGSNDIFLKKNKKAETILKCSLPAHAYLCLPHTCTHSYRGNAAEGGGGVCANAPQTRFVSLSGSLCSHNASLVFRHRKKDDGKISLEIGVWGRL